MTGPGRDTRRRCSTTWLTWPGSGRAPGSWRSGRAQPRPVPAVQVVTAAFEDWPLPAEPFDTVLGATAFRWVDPAVRVGKAADALRPGGVLATITTDHVAGGDESFFAEAQACYERWDPETPPGGSPLRATADIPKLQRGARPFAPLRPGDVPHRLRWPDRQALPDRAAGRPDHLRRARPPGQARRPGQLTNSTR